LSLSDSGIILVTGGSGHLGANLLRRLVEDGHGGRVRALYRPESNNQALDSLPGERVAGDLRDLEAMRRAVRGVERIYHCAARLVTVGGGEREIFDCNVVGTRNLLTAAREAGVRRVVVSGSFSAVGHLEDRPSDESVPFYPFHQTMPYEHTKALVELECWSAAAAGLSVVVATSCAILGPHDYKPSRMGEVLMSFASGRLPAYIPGGFEFVAARDIVAGHVLAMDKGRSGQKYIFGSGYYTLDDIMEFMESVTGTPRPRLRLPAPLMGAIATVTSPILTRFFPNVRQRLTPGAVRILRMGRRADVTKAKTELGFEPTSIKAAIQEAYDDFVRRGVIQPRHRGAAVTPETQAERRAPSPPSVGGGQA
jgi:nucleoside-diphosphate-sugar epimerase